MCQEALHVYDILDKRLSAIENRLDKIEDYILEQIDKEAELQSEKERRMAVNLEKDPHSVNGEGYSAFDSSFGCLSDEECAALDTNLYPEDPGKIGD